MTNILINMTFFDTRSKVWPCCLSFTLKNLLLFVLIVVMLLGTKNDRFAHASFEECCGDDMGKVLECYMKHDDGAFDYKLVSEERIKVHEFPNTVTMKTYVLTSQVWPIKETVGTPRTAWKHKLILYIPDKIYHSKAIVYAVDGYSHNEQGKEELSQPSISLDLQKAAAENGALVAEIQQIPNQLLLINNEFMDGDRAAAYTLSRALEDPLKDNYLIVQLPMVKSVIRAMDAAQEIAKKERELQITDFIAVGHSKRAWAIWLALLVDQRISGVVPIALDFLNFPKTIDNTCKSFINGCPPALRDYEAEGLFKKVRTPKAKELMKIIDPLSYLETKYDEKYKERLSVKKYIISASGDDFFVPDSSKYYFNLLPGEANYIRFLPNSSHFLFTKKADEVFDSLNTYFKILLKNSTFPKITWDAKPEVFKINSSIVPKNVKLWTATNKKERDFRCINSYSKPHLLWKKVASSFLEDACDNSYSSEDVNFLCNVSNGGPCEIHVPLPSFKKGWQAAFVELDYDIDGEEFITTTQVLITPNNYPFLSNAR